MLATHPHAMMVAGTILRSAVSFIIVLALAVLLPGLLPRLPANTPAAVNNAIVWLPTLLGWLALLAAVVLIVRTLGSWLTWNSREYVITNQRLLRTDGIVNKRSISVQVERINNLVINQSIVGRIFNYGSITVLSGNDYSSDVLTYVPAVLEYQRAVLAAQQSPGFGANPAAPTQPQRIISPYDRGGMR